MGISEFLNFQPVLYALLTAFIGICFISFLPSRNKALANLCFVFLIGVISSFTALKVLFGSPVEWYFEGSALFGGIPLRIDGLSAWFIIIINLTCFHGALFGMGYLKPFQDQRTAFAGSKANLSLHWCSYLIFQISMLGVCVIQHGFVFLIFWELMSFSSLLLVLFDHQRHDTLKAGLNYLVQMHVAVVFLSFAFIWVYFSERSFDFNAIGTFFSHHPNSLLFLIFFIGFGIKAGFISLHSWLPHAHPAAPSHVSGVMSGVIVKLGIYGIIRICFFMKSDLLWNGEWVLGVSVLTAVFGVLNAAVHRDFKKMLAYCTIENIGIIGIGIGLMLIGAGTKNPVLLALGLSGALLHTLNHSLFKSLLFFSAGSVYFQTHTRDMEKLGGLIRSMPETAILFLTASLAIAGMPPFNGFVSEFLIYSGFLAGISSGELTTSTFFVLAFFGLAITGGLSLLAFTKSFCTVFLGNQRQQFIHEIKEVPFIMRLPQYMIIAIMLSIGFFPEIYFSALERILISSCFSFQLPPPELNGFAVLMGEIGRSSFFFLLMIILLLWARKFFFRKRQVSYNSTWGCGYVGLSGKMQYTGKSFSKTLGKLFGLIVKEKKKFNEMGSMEIFPRLRNHSSHYTDLFENKIFEPFVNRLIHGLGYFRFIQNGRIQMYVLYGVFFIALVFLGTLFGLL